MSGLGALFAPLRLKSSQRQRLREIYYPWAIKNGLFSKPLINVYWEKFSRRMLMNSDKRWGFNNLLI